MFQMLSDLTNDDVDFMEVAPENWIGIGGRFGRRFREYAERFPIVCHGLSLSIGAPAPLDVEFVREVGQFLREFNIRGYSEHLSYCSDDKGHLYDLMPIPFTEESAHYVAGRVRQVQDILGTQIALENVSYYAAPGQEIDELSFVNTVLQEADCLLLLDVNNIYVNSVNFGYDPHHYLQNLDLKRTAYVHVAGHFCEAEDLRIDTHGTTVDAEVWSLLEAAYELIGPVPTLLERDFNFPPLPELLGEINQIRTLQKAPKTVRPS
ncbi:MAG: DUF692 family protein [Pseudomonadales bacterium]|nr:DUF692 family protein [Pseudomonadales bacterium]